MKRLLSHNKKSKEKDTNKKLRRNIKRIAIRKKLTYKEAILHFYNAKSIYEIDKNLLFSLYKNDIDLNRKF